MAYRAGGIHTNRRIVSGSRSLMKNLAKICSKTDPGGEILAEPAKIVRGRVVGLLWGGHRVALLQWRIVRRDKEL
jgi:hypothetical protein